MAYVAEDVGGEPASSHGSELASYPEWQRRLSGEVSPEEAVQARKLHKWSKGAWLGSCALIVLTSVLFRAGNWVGLDIPLALTACTPYVLPLVLAMTLITLWRVTWAGKTILPLATLIAPSQSDILFGSAISTYFFDSFETDAVLQVAIRSLLMLLLGWTLDLSARYQYRATKKCLLIRSQTGFASLFLLLVFSAPSLEKATSPSDRFLLLGNLFRVLLVVAWVFFVHPRLVPRMARYQSNDTSVVFRESMARWAKWLYGRGLAIVTLLIIIVATLNVVALPEAMESPRDDPAIVTKIKAPGESQIETLKLWWPRMGRFVRASDFSGNRQWFVADTMDKQLAQLFSIVVGPSTYVNKVFYKGIERVLEPYRTRTADEFVAALQAHAELDFHVRQLWMMEVVVAESPTDGGTAESGLNRIIEPLHSTLFPIAQETIDEVLRARFLNLIGAAGFSCLAFVMLWRRGGDSRAARWVGLWLAGMACYFVYPLMIILFGGTVDKMVGAIQDSRLQDTARGVTRLMVVYTKFLQELALSGISGVMIYWCLRPKTRRPKLGLKRSGKIVATISNSAWPVGTIAFACTVGVTLVAQLGTSGCWLILIFHSVALSALWTLERVRRRFNIVDPTDDPRLSLGGIPTCLYLGGMVLYIGLVFLRADSEPQALVWVALGATVTFISCGLLFVLRRDWLRVSAGRDLSWLVAAFLLPTIFEFVNSTLPRLLEWSGIVLHGAAAVTGLILVVLLMQPGQKWIERGFESISVPNLRRVRERIDQIFESTLRDPGNHNLDSGVQTLFAELGITTYSLWIREREWTFVLHGDHMSTDELRITLSEDLCERMAEWGEIVDLDAVSSEWRHFFDQFELYRIADRTKGRYLYPVVLGKSVWGLLVLGDSHATRHFARGPFKEITMEVGIALAKWRR